MRRPARLCSVLGSRRTRDAQEGSLVLNPRRLLIFVSLIAPACQLDDTGAVGPGGWLTGSTREKFHLVASQLRGFDTAMAETGYRYVELYWAAHDKNWDYAAYQGEKIGTAIKSGLRRRPKRAASARPFLEGTLPAVLKAVATRRPEVFAGEFARLTEACNSCHAAERVGFVVVSQPLHRLSPVRVGPR
jgi:hypothetical protein